MPTRSTSVNAGEGVASYPGSYEGLGTRLEREGLPHKTTQEQFCAGQTSKGVTSTAQRSSFLLNVTSTHSVNLYVSKLNNALYWLP